MTTHPASRRIVNVLALGGGELSSRLLAFVATAYLAIVLGPERFGILAFAFAIVNFISVILDTGFVDVGSRDVAKQPEMAASLASSLMIVRLCVAIICFTALTFSVWMLDLETLHALVLIATGLLFFSAALDTAWVFKGLEQGVPVSISLILRRFAYAGFVYIFVAVPEDILIAPLVQFCGELLGVLWLTHILFAEGFSQVNLALGWRTLRSCAPLIGVKLLRTSIISLDIVLLGLMATDKDVGLYSAPYRFCFFLMAVAGAIQIAYLPHIGRSKTDPGRRTAARRHLEISAALGIPFAAGGIFLASPLILLLFGADYLEATRAFQVLLVSIGILFLFSPLHNILLAQDRLRLEFWGLAVAAMLNLILNIIWIPTHGIVGAAWATVAAEMLILVWAGVAVWDTMGLDLLRPLAPPFIASGVMTAALLALPGEASPLYISIPIGVAVYVATLVVLSRVPEDIVAAFRRLVQRGSRA